MQRSFVLLLLVVAMAMFGVVSGVKFPGVKPRVRREWRQLSPEVRQKVADAIWTLKKLNSTEGKLRYGKNFNTHDSMLMLHAIATTDPRCDQGHFGPMFMTFHRALLLKYERALLAVDSSIKAMPYWDMALDSTTGRYRNTSDYIFSDKYFGSLYGNKTLNFAVDDGLFAFWPIAHWTADTFGATSELATPANRGIRQGWFNGTTADICERCCFDTTGTCNCDQHSDVFSTYLRAHQDCTPWMARNPADGPNANDLNGSDEIVFTEKDFSRCTNPKYIKNWMDVQNCVEISSVNCNVRVINALKDSNLSADELVSQLKSKGSTSDSQVQALQALASQLKAGNGSAPIDFDCTDPAIYGIVAKSSKNKIKVAKVNFFHSQMHLKGGLDALDVTTSPNSAAEFVGHHSNVDRLFFTWQTKTFKQLRKSFWHYPKDQTVNDAGQFVGTSGPFSTYDMGVCNNATVFYDYDPLSTPWLPGTLLNDVVNSGFPFFDLFECEQGQTCDGGDGGYTHRDILEWTSPERTPYTYDSLAHLYYKNKKQWA